MRSGWRTFWNASREIAEVPDTAGLLKTVFRESQPRLPMISGDD
jgi:hypothetical protein